MPAPQEKVRLLPIQLLQHKRAKALLPPALMLKADQARTHHDLCFRIVVREAVDRYCHLLPQLGIKHFIEAIQQHLGAVMPQPVLQRLRIQPPAQAFGPAQIIDKAIYFTLGPAAGVIAQLDQQRQGGVALEPITRLRPGQHQILK